MNKKYVFHIFIRCEDDLSKKSLYNTLLPEIENPENKRAGDFRIYVKEKGILVEVRTEKLSELIAITNSFLGLLYVALSAVSLTVLWV